jgi:hypothetical protein
MKMMYGQGDYRYQVVEGWGMGPEGLDPGGMITGVDVDVDDNLYAFRRSPDGCVLVYDHKGRFLRSWGHHIFAEPHAIWVDPTGYVYLTDREDHTVRKFNMDGELLTTMGTPHQVGAPGMPFNKPAKAVVSPAGEIVVADGYGQWRIHTLRPDGSLRFSFGERGNGPGQFTLPHSVIVDRAGRILVADREPNHKVQIFGPAGEFLTDWPGLLQPMDLDIDAAGAVFVGEAHQRMSIFSPEGEVLSRWGEKGEGPGQFVSFIHGICVDSRGDLYVADEKRLQKFARV